MSGVSPGAGWWQASDGNWYSPEQHPDRLPAYSAVPPVMQSPVSRPPQQIARPAVASSPKTPVMSRAGFKIAAIVVGVLVFLTILGYATKGAGRLTLSSYWVNDVADSYSVDQQAAKLNMLLSVLHAFFVLGILFLAAAAYGYSTRLRRITFSSKTRAIIATGKRYPLSWISGIVSGASKLSSTHVSGSFSASSASGTGSGQIRSRVVIQDDFVVTDSRSGQSVPFQLKGKNLSIDNGQQMQVVYAQSGRKSQVLLYRNRTLGQYDVDDNGPVNRMVHGLRGTVLYMCLGILLFVGVAGLSGKPWATALVFILVGVLVAMSFVSRMNTRRLRSTFNDLLATI